MTGARPGGGPVRVRVAPGSPRPTEPAARALAVHVFALFPSTVVVWAVVGGWGGMTTDLLDLVPPLLYPLGATVLTAWSFRLVGARYGRNERAGFAVCALLSCLVTVVVVALVALGLAAATTGNGGVGLTVRTAASLVGLALGVAALSGLPAWVAILAALIGPRERRTRSA